MGDGPTTRRHLTEHLILSKHCQLITRLGDRINVRSFPVRSILRSLRRKVAPLGCFPHARPRVRTILRTSRPPAHNTHANVPPPKRSAHSWCRAIEWRGSVPAHKPIRPAPSPLDSAPPSPPDCSIASACLLVMASHPAAECAPPPCMPSSHPQHASVAMTNTRRQVGPAATALSRSPPPRGTARAPAPRAAAP